jgi:Family of unknown function (DUF6098)
VRTVQNLDELAALVEKADSGEQLYVRWSKGPREDLAGGPENEQSSRDGLTGITLPGLSANSLRVEPWWGDRPVRLWVARRLYDYRHVRQQRGPGVRPWVLAGEERGRGPDNEPLVVCHRAISWISETALRECEQAVAEQGGSDGWGSLDRNER